MRTSKNSTAIDRAAAARSKSDEFSEVRMAVQKLQSHMCLKPPNRCCTFWDPESFISQKTAGNSETSQVVHQNKRSKFHQKLLSFLTKAQEKVVVMMIKSLTRANSQRPQYRGVAKLSY